MAESSASVVLITGCSSGIGMLAAETIARRGATVYASMRGSLGKNRKAAEALAACAADQRLSIHTLELDVTSEDSVASAVGEVIAKQGRIDVLVNNAGHMSIGVAEAFDEVQVEEQMNVNFLGPVRMCRAVLPHFRRLGRGLIIHVSSIAGRILFPGCAFYCASKFALEAYAEVLHYELTGTGIESVIVQPGPYPTHLLTNSPGPSDKDRVAEAGPLGGIRQMFMEHFRQFFSSNQSTNPQEVADAIAELIQLPDGQRRLRTVCGPDYGAKTINEHTASIQADVLAALGMTQMSSRQNGGGYRETVKHT